MATIRAFICFEIPKEVSYSLRNLIHNLKTCGRGVRWVGHNGIHLTLKFLGEVEEQQIAETESKLEHIASNFHPFSISISGPGVFPNIKKPRIFWVGLDEPTEYIQRIQQDIEKTLVPLGFEEEKRRFSPHLTLGRVKFNGPTIEKIARELLRTTIKKQKFSVNELVLMKSDLQPGGAHYTPIKKIKLGT